MATPRHTSDVMRHIASHPRNHGKGGTQNNSGGYTVTPEPVGDGFSWERVAAHQCVAHERYTLRAQCGERTWFTLRAADALQAAAGTLGADLTGTLLGSVYDAIRTARSRDDATKALEETINIKSIQVGMLNVKKNPPIQDRQPPGNDPDYKPDSLYETYKVTEPVHTSKGSKDVTTTYVQAPRCEVRIARPIIMKGGSACSCV